jgi:hypothetical protein
MRRLGMQHAYPQHANDDRCRQESFGQGL